VNASLMMWKNNS